MAKIVLMPEDTREMLVKRIGEMVMERARSMLTHHRFIVGDQLNINYTLSFDATPWKEGEVPDDDSAMGMKVQDDATGEISELILKSWRQQ